MKIRAFIDLLSQQTSISVNTVNNITLKESVLLIPSTRQYISKPRLPSVFYVAAMFFVGETIRASG